MRLRVLVKYAERLARGLTSAPYYDTSPIIAYDGARAPSYTMSNYTPSTVPGCRTPHFRRGDGRSLYDAMGAEFTLLRFDADADVTALEATARDRGLPLKLLDVEQPDPVTFYDGRNGIFKTIDQSLSVVNDSKRYARGTGRDGERQF